MKTLRQPLLIATAALAGCGSVTQTPTADPRAATPDTVYLLVRSDDAGMTHAVNMAKKELIESGMPVSVSIMFPTPWWQETVQILREHPDVSVGIHLTLNSEWKDYRWGPVVGQNAAPTLVDEDGFFFPSSRDLYDNDPDLGEVELELRAQIERAVDTGLQVDYVDFHMGTVRNHPGFLEIARRLAAEYGLLMSGFHDEVMWDPQYRADPGDKPDSLAAMVGRLASPFNVLITHPGLNTPEMAALEDMNTSQPLASMAMHRQGELDALRSPAFARALENSPVRLITYRELGTMLGIGGTAMMPPPLEPPEAGRTVLAAFAHPDDERIVGPLLARYAREGHDVHLLIATDGSKGVREHAGVPAGDSLASVRAAESRCATDELGIHPPLLLGLEDAGLASFASLERLRQEVARVLRELRPDLVISFGPEGGTGHPDHRLVGAVVTEVVQGGGDGIPQALYYPSLPAERMADAPPARPQIATVPREHLSAAVPFAPEDLEAAHRAFACHYSQYTRPEVDAIMRYLQHGFDGAVHLRPWVGTAERRTDLLDP